MMFLLPNYSTASHSRQVNAAKPQRRLSRILAHIRGQPTDNTVLNSLARWVQSKDMVVVYYPFKVNC